MRKVLYVSRILLSSFRSRLALIRIITFIVSFGLSMSIGVIQSQLHTQSYYLNGDMQDLAFLLDVETDYYWDVDMRGASTRRVRTQIEQWPGVLSVYEQTTVVIPDRGWLLYGYPAGLLDRLHLPTSEEHLEMRSSAYINPIWLDYNLISEYEIGDTISLNLSPDGENTCSQVFTVAGFLNEENVHYNFQAEGSSEVYSSDFISMNPDSIVCITVSDQILADSQFDSARSCAKFILPETTNDITLWKVIARQQGIGFISSMDDILKNDQKQIDLMSTPILVLCVIMIVLTLIGFIGTQLQLMNQHKQVAFSLIMTGMNWNTWKIAWLSMFCLPLWIASLIGASLGSAWKCVIMAAEMQIFTLSAFFISVAIVVVFALGIIPTISRWSHVDINEFRRLSE